MGRRLSRLAPEELAAAILLAVALIVVAADPHAVGRIFDGPYATPAPESGAATFLRAAPSTPGPSARPTAPRVIPEALQRVIPEALRGRGVIAFDRSGRAVEIADPCWEAAMAALRAGGQPVVCAPIPILTSPPSR